VQWFTPVIPATWEAEIREDHHGSRPAGGKAHETPSRSVVVCARHPSDGEKLKLGRLWARTWTKLETLSPK
jgi:hypothetical protein